MDQDNLPDLETVRLSRDVGFLMVIVENARWSDAEKGAELRRCAKLTLEGLRGSPEAEAVIRDLRSEDDRVRTGAIFAAGMIGDGRAIKPLLAIMRNPEEFEENWSYAGQSLGLIGDDRIVPELEAMLESEEFMILDGATGGLGRLGKRGLEALVRALRHPNPDVRSGAALALGDSRNAQAVEPLIRALRDEADVVRIDAAMALGQIGDERAVKPLTAMLEDPDPAMRGYAVRALGEMPGENSAERMRRLLRSKDPDIRLAAVETLMRLGEEISREIILRSLRDPDRRVRKAVSLTLERTHRPGIIALHQPIGGMCWQAETPEEELAWCVAAEKWEECIGFGEEAIDPLMAIYPCGKDCDMGIANALMQIIQRHPVSAERRKRIIRLLRGEAMRTWRRRTDTGEGQLC